MAGKTKARSKGPEQSGPRLTDEEIGLNTYVAAVAGDDLAMRQWLLIKSELDRREGARRSRGPRRPVLSTWLDEQLTKNPGISDKALWRALEAMPHGDSVWIEGDKVFEGDDTTGLTAAGFGKQATAARKRR